MTVSDLSASAQNYLKAVWRLSEWSDAPVTTSLIAERTGVRASTASDGIRKLTEQGLLAHARYGAITLTEQGRSYALAMVRRHRLIEALLVDVLGYRWDQVHDEAEVLEHAVSDFMIDQIDRHLGYPERDPHGDPIPAADGTMVSVQARPLCQDDAGSTVVVERISDEDPELLQFFDSEAIRVGSELDVSAGPPFAGSIEVTRAGGDHSTTLGREAMTALYVTPRDVPAGA